MVFLSETRLKDFELQHVKRKTGFSCCQVIDCRGNDKERAGGVALFWHDSMDVVVMSFYLSHICVWMGEGESEKPWFFMGIYGFPKKQNKWRTYELIQQLKGVCGKDWLCAGDFNDVLTNSDYKGGLRRNISQLD